MPLDLLVPDLLLPPDAPPAFRSTRLRSLERWLARADVERDPAANAAAWLAQAFAIGDPPVAALDRLGEGAPTDGAWMRADPVHLRIDRDSLRLHDASLLDVGRDEAAALVAALQAHFGADGLEFHAAAPDRWYVRLAAGEAPRTTPLADALGRNVFGLLPHDGRWRAAMTEAQMILSNHAVNERREAQGRIAINSIWFWGAGPLPEPSRKPYAAVHSGDPFARGLAKWSGAEARPVPASISEVDLVRVGDGVLVAIDDLSRPLRRGDAEAWATAAASLDERWFASLSRAIDRFDRVRLVLPAAGATCVATLTRAARWRWYRSAKPLSAYA